MEALRELEEEDFEFWLLVLVLLLEALLLQLLALLLELALLELLALLEEARLVEFLLSIAVFPPFICPDRCGYQHGCSVRL